VADYDPPGDVHSAWTIFDRDGAVSGRVMAPQGFSVLEIGGDYILGVYRDDMGVEYLRQYSLQRPEAP
jgi:hypothetical protein